MDSEFIDQTKIPYVEIQNSYCNFCILFQFTYKQYLSAIVLWKVDHRLGGNFGAFEEKIKVSINVTEIRWCKTQLKGLKDSFTKYKLLPMVQNIISVPYFLLRQLFTFCSAKY